MSSADVPSSVRRKPRRKLNAAVDRRCRCVRISARTQSDERKAGAPRWPLEENVSRGRPRAERKTACD